MSGQASAIADGYMSGSGKVTGWLEIWAFVAENMGERNLFVFFDANVLGRDLKKA
jgi:hypothetical protein